MFASGHHIVMGSSEDPKDGKGVAAAVFGAVVVYGVRIITTSHKAPNSGSRQKPESAQQQKLTKAQVFLVFCGGQAFLHQRQRAGGEIALR
jgi:phosphoribosylcarboxyaminoimidazole (NCAIR) mutase